MARFDTQLFKLISQIDEQEWESEVARLRRCRSLRDLEQLAIDGGGWLSSGSTDPRLKLVRHNSGTFLVVKYVDGWSSRVGMQDFPR